MSDDVKSGDIYIPVPGDRSWYDPLLINANCSLQYQTITLVANTPTIMAPATGKRWAIGFFLPPSGSTVQFSPWPDITSFIFDTTSLSVVGIRWYTLFTYGPLICNQWWAFSPSTPNVRVVQVYRN